MTPHDATAAAMLAALVLYALFGGADFGAGVLDLFASGPRKAAQRRRIAEAISPIWEANHVWLILVVVLLFAGFPRAFGALMTALHVPVTLVLIGIVARGSAFIFNSYAPREDSSARTHYGRWFSIASLLTPILLGVVLGTCASGALTWQGETYTSGFFSPWLRPFPWCVGLFTLVIFAYLAAVYLCAEVEDGDLRDDFRARALVLGLAVGLIALVTIVVAHFDAPEIAYGLTRERFAWPLHLTTGAAAIGALAALWHHRFKLARSLAALQCALIVVGHAYAMAPYLIVPDWTLAATAAPERTHIYLLVALAIGAVFLFPSLAILFRVFKGRDAFAVVDKDSA